jgi:multimeric flavodoxin WrbA
MARIIGISGSPRKNGNSERILEHSASFFSERGIEFDAFRSSDGAIGPCSHCDYCRQNDRCIDDDDANDLNNRLALCDGILVVTPVFFGSMTGQMKCIIDKTIPLRRNGFF